MAIIFDDMVISAPPTGKINNSPGGDVDAPAIVPANGTPPLPAPTAKTSKAKGATAAPTAKASAAKAPIAAPVVITPRPADPVAPPFPLNHARILWENKLLQGAALSSSPAAVSISAMLSPATYSRATFSGPSVITAIFSVQRTFDSVGIAAHTLAGTAISIEYRPVDTDPWTLFYTGTMPRGALLVCEVSPLLVKEVRITTTAAGSSLIGVLYVGVSLQMQRPIFRGVEPVTLNRVTEYTNNQSEGGQWLGRDINRQGLKTAPTWRNLSAAWVREYFDPFAQAARQLPFFYSWDPQAYPQDAAYCWTTGDIKQTITGPRDLMSVEMDLKGHA